MVMLPAAVIVDNDAPSTPPLLYRMSPVDPGTGMSAELSPLKVGVAFAPDIGPPRKVFFA